MYNDNYQLCELLLKKLWLYNDNYRPYIPIIFISRITFGTIGMPTMRSDAYYYPNHDCWKCYGCVVMLIIILLGDALDRYRRYCG